MKTPTYKQYGKLCALGIHYTAIVPGRRDWTPMLNHGWVEITEADEGKRFLPPIRVTADGLRAIALGIEKYGHPHDARKDEPATPKGER